MPYATEIAGYYWDFGNGYVPYFAVIGAFNILMYGGNTYGAAIATVPDAIASFQGVGVVNPVADISLFYNETETIDVSNVFAQIDGLEVTVSLEGNSNPEIAEVVLEDDILTITTGETSGNTTVTLLGVSGEDSATEEFTVTVTNPDERFVLILDLDPTPTGSTLQSSIENFYNQPVHIVENFSTYPLSNTDALFVLLGIFSNNHQLTAAQAAPIITYLENGGNVYMEGGDTWYYDTQTALHPYFNINAVADGLGDLANVYGHDFLDGMSWTYSGENSWIDHIDPVSPAVTIFNSGSYNCGVAYDAGSYKTVGTSFEITGLGGTNSLDDAVQGILNFFGLSGGQQYGFITGTVFDEFGNPLEGATIESGDYSTFADENGGYYLELPSGYHTITAFLEGFEPTTAENVLIMEGEITFLDFHLTFDTDAPESVLELVTQLEGNYPNPFNPTTNIKFSTGENGHVTLDIYNVKGQKVATLVDEQKEAGNHSVVWNGKDESGRTVSSGVYFSKMRSAKYTATKKMILMK